MASSNRASGGPWSQFGTGLGGAGRRLLLPGALVQGHLQRARRQFQRRERRVSKRHTQLSVAHTASRTAQCACRKADRTLSLQQVWSGTPARPDAPAQRQHAGNPRQSLCARGSRAQAPRVGRMKEGPEKEAHLLRLPAERSGIPPACSMEQARHSSSLVERRFRQGTDGPQTAEDGWAGGWGSTQPTARSAWPAGGVLGLR